jgi:hypothetical protein
LELKGQGREMNSVIDILRLGSEVGVVQVTNITMRLRALDKHGRVGTCNRLELTAQDETLLLVAHCEADTGETQRRIAAGSVSPINGLLPATGYSRKGERGFLAALASSLIVGLPSVTDAKRRIVMRGLSSAASVKGTAMCVRANRAVRVIRRGSQEKHVSKIT